MVVAVPTLGTDATALKRSLAGGIRNRSRSMRIGAAAILVVVVVLALPIWLPDPNHPVVAIRLHGPSAGHWFGTDEFGRDVFTRVIYGARLSWLVALTATVCSLVAGGIYGALSALGGRWVDAVMMRVLEVLLAFPSALLALVLAIAIGPGLRTLIIAIAIVYTAPVARLVRGLVLDELKNDYVASALIIGSSRVRILARHITINVAGPVLAYLMLVAADAILVEAALSYLGAGVAPPTSSWGSMVQEGQNLVYGGVWWVSLFGGLAIAATAFTLYALADSISDELRLGRRRG